MPVPNETPISYAKIREEGNKISWISSDYPTIGRQYNIEPNWMISADENNSIGFNPSDGSFDITQMQGWDTWKRPSIDWVGAYQYEASEGLIVGFQVSAGDVYRSLYKIQVLTGGYSGTVVDTFQCRFAPEFNPSADKNLKYCKNYLGADKLFQATNAPSKFYELESMGGLNEYEDYPAYPVAGALITPDDTVNPSLTCVACFFDLPAGEIYYAKVSAADGRISDTLNEERGTTTFSLNVPSGETYTAAINADYSNTPIELLDADDAGNGSIEVFDGLGTPSIKNEGFDSFQVDIENAYTYYFNQKLYYWVFYYQGDGDQVVQIPEPSVLYPEDNPSIYHEAGDEDKLYPYEGLHELSEPFSNDISGNDQYRWILRQGEPVVSGLLEDTDYTVYVTTFKASDMDRYTENGRTASAPANDGRQVYGPFTASTTSSANVLGTPMITDVYIATGDVYIDLNYAGDDPTTYEIDYAVDDPSLSSPNTATGSWGSNSGTKTFNFTPTELPNPGETMYVRIKAVRTGYGSNFSTIEST